MMVTIDWVARRYGVLPSRLLNEGDSIDIFLANLGQAYENHLNEKIENKSGQNLKSRPDLSQEQMLKMIEEVKNKS